MPRKTLTISDMRKQSRLAHYTSRTNQFNAGSAYGRLHEQNRRLAEGSRRRYDDEDEDDEQEEHRVLDGRVAKKPKPAVSRVSDGLFGIIPNLYAAEEAATKKPPTKPKKRATPPPPEIESWRPAGGEDIFGDRINEESQPTATFAIARTATWRLPTFNPAIKALIEQYGELVKCQTKEHFHGGESVTDMFAEFADEEEATMVKHSIDGEVVEGRKLQVGFASGQV